MQLDLHDIHEQMLTQWMQQYGDTILRTCYLLCGDMEKARPAAQRVFIRAYEQMVFPLGSSKTSLRSLLQIALEDCPCPLCPGRIRFPDSTVSKLLLLSPAKRKVAILCLYHPFSIRDAADILHTTEQAVRRRLSSVQKLLK